MLYSVKPDRPVRTGGAKENPIVHVRVHPYMFKYIDLKSQELKVSMASIVRMIIQEKIRIETMNNGKVHE